MTDTRPLRLERVAPATPAAPSSAAAQWIATHKPAAAGAAAAVLVVGLALRSRAGGQGAAGANDGTGNASTPGALTSTAGLSGTPDTSATDIENWVQDALNASNAAVNAQLAAGAAAPTPTPPAAPSGPTPAPRPGAGRWLIHKGDTLARIATAVYGRSDAPYESALRRANPILASYPATSRLDWLAGHTLTVPKPPAAPVRKPTPSKPAKPVKRPPVKRRPAKKK